MMKIFSMRLVFGLAGVALLAGVASADTLFAKALKEKYGFKTVLCSACHMDGKDPATQKPYDKTVRNDFGKLFEAPLHEKNMEESLAKDKVTKTALAKAREEVNDADITKYTEEKKVLDAQITKDFLEALLVVEAMKDDSGTTWADVLQADDLKMKGIRLKGEE